MLSFRFERGQQRIDVDRHRVLDFHRIAPGQCDGHRDAPAARLSTDQPITVEKTVQREREATESILFIGIAPGDVEDQLGSELIQRLQVAGFRGKCIVISGYLSPEVEAIYHGLGVEYIISKPFDLAQLRTAVAASARAIEAAKN